jgi:hypothetical protein
LCSRKVSENPRESGAERKHSLVNTQVSSFPPYRKSRMAKDWSQGKVLIFNEIFHYGSLARSTWSPSVWEWPPDALLVEDFPEN